ncbi:M20/M25/M40 family metallo-hydrolase [Brevibacterium luteolum]|uniref:M20/M25/M40 family metallo-hydrolase n=2 Tax=Brevibacterium luteolum TaxID=199591 RepID=A0A849AN42_9MICO|nr:M20/M25/M40 family metallo-hydrolase [Brevibacterium luteolum]
MSNRLARAAVAVTAAAALGLGMTSPAMAAPVTEHTDMGVTGDQVFKHLTELNEISEANKEDGYRALGTKGYEEASEYVEGVMKEAGFEVERQEFDLPRQTFDEVSLSVNGVEQKDFGTISNAEGTEEPLTDVPMTLPAGAADNAGLGCSGEAFTEDNKKTIVLIQRGECAFGDKITNASKAGAAGVIIYNNQDGASNFTAGDRVEGNAPAGALSKAEGDALVEKIKAVDPEGPKTAVTADMTVETTFETVKTWNVMAETKAGDPDNVQMMGAHLDGVPEGPGVNDNASGVAGLLAVAEGMAGLDYEVDNKVRFGFWVAEEVGLVGSTHYVNDLAQNNPEELKKIKAYLNYDMIGSENYVVGTLDSDGSDVKIPDGVTVPEGSAELEKIFTDYFDDKGQLHIGTEFSGRSDYQAFIDNGVPVSGLFSGADGIKTEEDVKKFGGTAGVPRDRYYHTPEDNLENVNQESLGIFAPAMAFAAHTLAYNLEDEDDDNGDEDGGKDDDAPAERGLTVKPEQISPADFVKEDKGVTIMATGCTPGTEAKLTVEARGIDVLKHEDTATVDEDGNVTFAVHGVNADRPNSYVGTYDVRVACDGGDDLTGTFTVGDVKDDDGKGGEDDKGKDDKGKLPRTGSEAGPLVWGAAALLIAGIGITAATLRRKSSL